MIATELGLDPIAFRLRHAVRDGDPDFRGEPYRETARTRSARGDCAGARRTIGAPRPGLGRCAGVPSHRDGRGTRALTAFCGWPARSHERRHRSGCRCHRDDQAHDRTRTRSPRARRDGKRGAARSRPTSIWVRAPAERRTSSDAQHSTQRTRCAVDSKTRGTTVRSAPGPLPFARSTRHAPRSK